METGNQNWRWKLETEWKQKLYQSLVQCLLHSVFIKTLVSSGTGFIYDSCFAFTLALCVVITYVIDWCSCGKQCYNLVWFTFERVWAQD